MNDQEMIECVAPEKQLCRLRAIMHRLRGPGGCPWDAEQTHESILTNLIEEAYETVDAIQSGDLAHMKEELGDLLLQVVFHAELAQEKGHFNLDDIAKEISDKLVRRHPHVYGESGVETSDQVLVQWDAIKRKEQGLVAESYLHGVGKGLPAWMRAAKLQKKAAKIGFDWPSKEGVIAKIREELEELEQELQCGNKELADEELGDLLFSVVNLVRYQKLDPEVLMAKANRKFEQRFAQMERLMARDGLELGKADLDLMDAYWNRAKNETVES